MSNERSDKGKIVCPWCDKLYDWDWDQDVIVGLKPIEFTSTDRTVKEDVQAEVYFCTCGGIVAVSTLDPEFGGATLEYRPESYE